MQAVVSARITSDNTECAYTQLTIAAHSIRLNMLGT